jgi:tetratricopeptide (TPR) repeat protein
MEKALFETAHTGIRMAALTLSLALGCASAGRAGEFTNAQARAAVELQRARQQFTAQPTNAVAAWELGRACFIWGKVHESSASREKIFREGEAACRRGVALASNSAPAHYYLAMNTGRIANLKRNLSALGLLKDAERGFQQARQLDEHWHHAGPDRNLGLLYQHVPGWPVSLGDQKLARKHLKRAAELAADYPENRLNLAEAALAWKDRKLAATELAALQALWPAAKTNLVGPDWEVDWADWEQRRAALMNTLKAK